MSSHNPAQPDSLGIWLDIATRGLCDEAKARITEDVVSHVDEAFDHLLLEDYSPNDAIQKALEDLGNPRRARRQFRRVHLTQQQAELLEKAIGEKAARRSRLFRKWLGLPMAGIMGLLFLTAPAKEGAFTIYFLIIIAIVFLMLLWAPLQDNRKKSADDMLLLCTIKQDLIPLAGMVLLLSKELNPDLLTCAVYGLFCSAPLGASVERLPIYRKLKRTKAISTPKDNLED